MLPSFIVKLLETVQPCKKGFIIFYLQTGQLRLNAKHTSEVAARTSPGFFFQATLTLCQTNLFFPCLKIFFTVKCLFFLFPNIFKRKLDNFSRFLLYFIFIISEIFSQFGKIITSQAAFINFC